MRYCTHCGKQLPGGAGFCIGCGAPMPATALSGRPAVSKPMPKSARGKKSTRGKLNAILAAAVVVAGCVVGGILLFGSGAMLACGEDKNGSVSIDRFLLR